jgi:Protein of unknown function (DUF3617)
MKQAYSAAAVLLLLAACGQSGGGNQQAPAATKGGATAAAGAGAGGGALAIQPGEWEVTTQMQMSALPNGVRVPDMPPTSMRHCVTAEDVARSNRAFLGGGGQHGVDCDYRGVTIAGGRIQGTSRCTSTRAGGNMEMTMTMDGTMTPTSYDVDQQMQMIRAGQTTAMRGHMSGRRIGACPSSATP